MKNFIGYIIIFFAFIAGGLVHQVFGPEKISEPVVMTKTTYVSTPMEGERLVREMYDTLFDECRKVPWKYDLPKRPTCEMMSMVAVSELLLHGSFEGRATPVQ